MAFTYQTGFKSHSGQEWDIILTDTWVNTLPVAEPTREYITRGEGFKLRKTGKKNDPHDPIKASSCVIQWICRTAPDENRIDELFDLHFGENVYAIIFKGSALYWWGYVQPNVSTKKNEYFSFTYTIEAQDTLAMMSGLKVYDVTYPGTFQVGQSWVEISKFRFGAPRSTTFQGATAWPKEMPSVIEVIYSLLFDLDPNPDGVLIAYDSWRHQFSNAKNELWHTLVPIWGYLFNDVPAQNPFGLPIERRFGVTASEILYDILTLFCLRIFQQDGLYYIIQLDMYDGIQSLPTVQNRYRFRKNPVATGSHPIYDEKRDHTTKTLSLLNSEITYPSGQFKIIGESSWEKLHGIFATTMNGMWSAGFFDYIVKQKINTTTNNLSAYAVQDMEEATEFPLLEILAIDPGSPLFPPQQPAWRREFGTAWFHTYGIHVNTRLEYRNGYRKKFKATIKGLNYDMLKILTYDGVDYIAHDITFSANLERWSGTWIERVTDGTNVAGEVEGHTTDDGQDKNRLKTRVKNWLRNQGYP